ncbi:MAG: hypothetical protein IK141_03920 [Clostridia bacterium]|nr:hypothetical protein [Clostridia bacterium]
MEYLGFIFGIFGFFAYLQYSSLKKRVSALEEELAGIHGTASFTEKRTLLDTIGSYVGKAVVLDLKEDCEDIDIVMYGNTKHGTNTIVDADEDWILVRIESAKGNKEKLIRVGSVQRISVIQD